MSSDVLNLSGREFFPIPDFHLSVVPVNQEAEKPHNWENYTFTEHVHAFSEMVVVTSGTAVQNIDGTDYPVREGDLFLIDGNTRHFFQKSNSFSLMNLLFDRHALALPWSMFQRRQGYNMFFLVEPKTRAPRTFRNRLHLDSTRMRTLRTMLERLSGQLWQKDPYCEFRALAGLLEIISFVSQSSEEQNAENRTIFPNISGIISLLEKHSETDFSVEQLARMACTSPRNFTRQFRKATGYSPIGFLLGIRLNHAAELLMNSNLRMSEIAIKCGFSDSNYFTKSFGAKFGISPREYRRYYRGPNQPD